MEDPTLAKKEKKPATKEKIDIATHASEPHLASHTNKWYVPEVDLYELDNEVVIEMDMPGVSESDVEMKMHGDEIIVTGHVVHEEDRDDSVLYREYDEGHFHRHFLINETIDRERISPVISNGVLRITLPKKEDFKPRKIKVRKG
jgi:HSP20 family protein